MMQNKLMQSKQCKTVQAAFSAYLDGDMSGHAMAEMSTHLDSCDACATEFELARTVQHTLGQMGPSTMPDGLAMRLRLALAAERAQQSYLSPAGRLRAAWQATIAPMALRVAGGFTAALVLVGGLSWMFAAPIAVQANDDRLANLAPPQYLYSQVPPQPIPAPRDTPIIVQALVNEQGRVYDYTILDGPRDPQVRVRVEDNLLASVFRPATVFGAPVRGHVVLTYTGVSVRG